MYKIKEVETNIKYDSQFYNITDAKKEVKKYIQADIRHNREITYVILDESNNVVDEMNFSK